MSLIENEIKRGQHPVKIEWLPVFTLFGIFIAAMINLTGIKPLPDITRTPLPPKRLVIPQIQPQFASIIAPPQPKPAPIMVQTDLMIGYFNQIGYKLTPGQPVPPVFIKTMPSGMAAMVDIPARKSLFFRVMLPLILGVNQEIAQDRARLTALAQADQLSERDRLWVQDLAKTYRAAAAATAVGGGEKAMARALLLHVDEIPVSLALAQSAEESGWGTSRFTKLGNALFGQWAFSQDAGIVPQDRSEGENHVIRAFGSLKESVRAYMLNLNRHAAYAEMRARRAELRAAGTKVSGHALARSLLAYSERGEDYVKSLHNLIEGNGLSAFDGAKLTKEAPHPPLPDFTQS